MNLFTFFRSCHHDISLKGYRTQMQEVTRLLRLQIGTAETEPLRALLNEMTVTESALLADMTSASEQARRHFSKRQ